MIKESALIVLLTFIAGCASLSNGQTDSVTIVTKDDNSKNTQCTAKNEEFFGEEISSLETISVHRDGNPLEVNCINETQTGTASIDPEFQSRYLVLDLLSDLCIISCLIDGGSNAFYDYPATATVNMISKHP